MAREFKNVTLDYNGDEYMCNEGDVLVAVFAMPRRDDERKVVRLVKEGKEFEVRKYFLPEDKDYFQPTAKPVSLTFEELHDSMVRLNKIMVGGQG